MEITFFVVFVVLFLISSWCAEKCGWKMPKLVVKVSRLFCGEFNQSMERNELLFCYDNIIAVSDRKIFPSPFFSIIKQCGKFGGGKCTLFFGLKLWVGKNRSLKKIIWLWSEWTNKRFILFTIESWKHCVFPNVCLSKSNGLVDGVFPSIKRLMNGFP